MASIYQIRQEISEFLFNCDPETGEILNSQAWDEINLAFEEKVENIACWIKNLQAEAEDLKAEEAALAKRRKAKEAKIERLKNLLTDNMDGKKFETAKCAVSFRTSEQLQVEDKDLIPKKYCVKKVEYQPDKNLLKQIWKSGKAVKGCQLIQKLNVNIK